MPRGFNVCPFFRLFLENAAKKVFSYWRRPGHIIMTLALKQRKTFVFEKTNSSSNDNENCWSFHFPLNIVQRLKFNVYTIQIKIPWLNTHLHEITLTIFHNIFETILKIHPIIPFFEMKLTQFCWYEKYVKSVKRWKSLLYQSCFFLLKTRVDFFWLCWKDPLFDRIIDLCVDCK